MRNALAVGLLVLVLAAPAAAVPVDAHASDGIAASAMGDTNWQLWILTTAGEVWSFDSNNEWEHEVHMTPPVPLVQLAQWWPRYCMTTDGRYFRLQDQSWVAMPPPPFAPVSQQRQTLGGVKGSFR